MSGGAEPRVHAGVGPSPGLPGGAQALVVTVSDRAHAGVYEDRSGPLLARLLADLGFEVRGPVVVPDEQDAVVAALEEGAASGVDLIATTGGTGFAPRDVTPEATRHVIDREAPGLAEAIRSAGKDAVPTAILSRGLAGLRGSTIIVNLPGSSGGVRDGVAVLAPVVGHAVAQTGGRGDHGGLG